MAVRVFLGMMEAWFLAGILASAMEAGIFGQSMGRLLASASPPSLNRLMRLSSV